MSTRIWSNSSRINNIISHRLSTKNLSVATSSTSSETRHGSLFTSPLIAAATITSLFVVVRYGNNDENNKLQCHGGKATSQPRRREQLETFLKKSSQQTKSINNLHQLPIFTSEDVAKRNGQQQSKNQQGYNENNNENENVVWMSYGGYVYDVTNFIPLHPGGTQRVERAAGSALEPYWFLHQQHFDTDIPLEILENLIVGRLAESDQIKIDDEVDKLQDEIDKFELIVEMMIDSDHDDGSSSGTILKKLSMKQLTMLPKTDQISQVGCPENQDLRPITRSLFAGVLLEHLLPPPPDLSTREEGQQQEQQQQQLMMKITFHAMDGEKVTIDVDDVNDDYYKNILVCYEMDGAALTKSRGFPIRIIIPESEKRNKKRRAVKWVHKITIVKKTE